MITFHADSHCASNEAMDVDEAREALTSHPLKLSNEYLRDLLNGTVEEHGQDTSGVLDYDTPEALCPILRPTYSGLPLLQYVNPYSCLFSASF